MIVLMNKYIVSNKLDDREKNFIEHIEESLTNIRPSILGKKDGTSQYNVCTFILSRLIFWASSFSILLVGGLKIVKKTYARSFKKRK